MTDFGRSADERAALGCGAMNAGFGRLGGVGTRLAPMVAVTDQDRVPLVLSIVEPIEIGRDCRGLNLLDASISRRHLALHPFAHGLFVTDLASRNGSTVDGRPLSRRHRLDEGEVVRFGGCTLVVVRSRPDAAAPAGGIPAIPDDPPATSMSRLADHVLVQLTDWPPDDAGTVTIVVTGIEGSTTSPSKLRDVEWHDALAIHNRVQRAMLARYRGSAIYPLGVGSIACLGSARSALGFVIDVQRALAAYAAANPTAALRYRTGIHTGESVVGDAGCLFGMHVAMAAAIADEARMGEILVSSLVREILEPCGEFQFGAARTVKLNGPSGMHLLHAVVR